MPRNLRVSWKKFQKFVLSVGCVYARTKGDHLIYRRGGLTRPIVIPMDNPLSPGVVEGNLRTLGVTKSEFAEVLKKL